MVTVPEPKTYLDEERTQDRKNKIIHHHHRRLMREDNSIIGVRVENGEHLLTWGRQEGPHVGAAIS